MDEPTAAPRQHGSPWTAAQHPASGAPGYAREAYVFTAAGTVYGLVSVTGDWVHVEEPHDHLSERKSFPVARVQLIEWA